MNRIKRWIWDIFLDSSPEWGSDISTLYAPQDLRSHYEKDWWYQPFDSLMIATTYEPCREQIYRYKYYGDRTLARTLFAPMIVELLEDCSLWHLSIIPIPMHWTRYSLRGYDHTWVITQEIARLTGQSILPCLSASFRFRQSILSRRFRFLNKQNSIRLNRLDNIPKEVILFDDVISSGATVLAAEKALRSAWVERIHALFIASNQ